MGSAASAHDGIPKDWMSVFHAMQFTTHEVRSFYDTFNSIDTDHSGSIDVVELLKFLDIENSLFTERIFAAFDKDGTGKIDFFEFVVALWKFCALGKESIYIFAFDLYDTDGDGALTEIEVKVMFHDLYWYGTVPKENQESRATLAELLNSGDGFITIEEFRPFCFNHEHLLDPLFAVQTTLRNAVMGHAFWDMMSKRRITLSHGNSIELGQLMVRSSDRDEFNQILDEKSSGLRGLMMTLFKSSGSKSSGSKSPEKHAYAEQRSSSAEHGSEKSLSRLLNPFRTFSSQSREDLPTGANSAAQSVVVPPPSSDSIDTAKQNAQ